MKKSALIIVLASCFYTGFSQTDDSVEKRIKYGFSLGLNYSNLLHNETILNEERVTNNVGFRVGLLGEYILSKALFISPKIEISFNRSKVDIFQVDESKSIYEVMPVSLDFATHFGFRNSTSKLKPYFYIGPNFKLPLSKEEQKSTEFSTKPDLAIDFGIGFDKAFTNFSFSPELRYSFGLLNVNNHPSIESLNYHNISFALNFKK